MYVLVVNRYICMFDMQSITGRIAVGKLVGLVTGVVVMVMLPSFGYPFNSMLGWGTMLMFILMGAMIGMMGMYTEHPVFGFKMKWWLRGPLVGMSFMLMFILLAHDEIAIILQSSLLSWMNLESPFWALIDGLFIGGIIGYLSTRISGEGPDLPIK